MWCACAELDSPSSINCVEPLRATAGSERTYGSSDAHGSKYVILCVHYGVNVQIILNSPNPDVIFYKNFTFCYDMPAIHKSRR